MDTETIKQRKQAITEKFGEWTNHNIQLDGDVYTIGQQLTGAEVKVKRILQIVADIKDKPFEELRVLDLACLEGLYGLELALHGAQVVAVEGRVANIEKARFAKEVLALENLEIVQDDVRNLSREKYGCFDVVLCLGILYHLDAPDVFHFLENIAETCRKVAIIDTHASMDAEKSYVYKKRQYWGKSYREHSPDSTPEERDKSLWASLDNLASFWLTRPSFYNFLSEIGFTSIYECHNPPVIKYELMKLRKETDRNTFVAIKGSPTPILSSAIANQMPAENWPEKQQLEVRSTGI